MFPSFNGSRRKKEFSRAAASVEGSGWATLALDNKTRKLLILTRDFEEEFKDESEENSTDDISTILKLFSMSFF